MGLGIKGRLTAAVESFFSESGTRAIEKVIPPQESLQKGNPPAVAGAGTVPPVPGVVPWGDRYPYGINLSMRPRGTEPLSFQNLRGIAKNCELVRIAIQIKKEQIRGIDWDIVVRPGYDAKEYEPMRKRVKDFLRYPDRNNDLNFNDFMTQWLEDILVLDAGVLWWNQDRAGRTTGMTIVNGATIRPVLTDQGYVPMPPDPAYAQVIDGRVHGTYTRDEMLYCSYNPRSDSPYGLSLVEMVVMSAHISMKRQLSNLSFYTDGNVPEHFLIAPPEWSPSQIREVQDYLDAYLSGDVAKKHKLKLIPGGTTLKETRPPDFTVQVDDWLMRIVSAIFGVAPHVLLQRTRTSTKGSAQVTEDQQSDIGYDPFKKYIKETIDEKVIAQKLNSYPVMFSWLSDKAEAENQNLARAKALVPVGAIGVDELRAAEGKIAIGIPAYIQMANGLLFLTPQVLDAIKSGKVNFIDAGGVPSNVAAAEANAAAAPGGGPGHAAPKTPQAAKLPGSASQQKILFEHELGQFKRAVINDIKKGEPSLKPFTFNFIPDDQSAVIKLGLERCATLDQVKAFFSQISHEALEMRTESAAVSFHPDAWTKDSATYWLSCNGYKTASFRHTIEGLVFDQVPPDSVDWASWTSDGLPQGVRILIPVKDVAYNANGGRDD